MKRKISLLLSIVLILSLIFATVSCGKESDKSKDKSKVTTEITSVETTSAPTLVEPTTGAVVSPDVSSISPLMWRVTDTEGHSLYLFGTMHVGDERNDAVLTRISPTLEKCDALAVEFDLVAYEKDTQNLINDMQQYVLTDGSSVSDYMPADLYNRSYELLNKAGLFPSVFTRYNLSWWAQLVDSALLMVYSDLDSEKGIDYLLIHRANEKNIPVLEVESSDFQMNLLNSFDNKLYIMMIEEALDSADTYNKDLNELYNLWLSGNKDELWESIASETEEDEDDEKYTAEQIALIKDYNYKLTDERNIGMKNKAIEYLNSGRTVFFAVGAAHMANNAGIVKLLTDAGYYVEQITY